jgi:FkbM family methyltransferase
MTGITPLIVYGLGATGQAVVDALLDEGVDIEMILDRGKRGQDYRGIRIEALEDLGEGRLSGKPVLLALHNHYVDIRDIHSRLLEAGSGRVLTLQNLRELVSTPRTNIGYWLDLGFDYDAHADVFERMRRLLADETSLRLFDAILSYRRTGDIALCPAPSLDDEYTPADLPRYAEPLRLVDCGAFTGVAVHKFLKAGYAIDSLAAFEPDPASFATLSGRQFPVARSLCLPLGTWSSTTQLRFASDSSMASHLSETGDVVIQCVAIDDVLHGQEVNLVKLDVEGAEIETLKGMERIIREQRPNLLVSAYHTPAHLYEIAELVDGWQLGYRFHLRVHEHNTFGVVLYCLRDALLVGEAPLSLRPTPSA